jgi:trafficking protein particle complex subunit 10
MKLFASRCLHLDRNRFLEVELSSGWNNVSSGELHIRAATAGLRLQTSDVKVVNSQLEIFKRSEAGVIRFGALKPESKVKILVPFNLENDVNDISLKLEISYTTERGTFFSATNPSISIMLPLGVNVQDVFKHDVLFSRFTISSATSSPLRLLKSKLEKSDVFEAQNGGDLPNPVMVFPRQPASLLYKITRYAAQTAASSTPSNRRRGRSSLSLIVHYICLEEEIENAVTSALIDGLSETPLLQYSRLIIPTLISQLNSRLSPYVLERIALTGELSLSILSGINWCEFFLGLGRRSSLEEDISSLVARWIQMWCEQRARIELTPLDTSDDTIAKCRTIIIPVEVPSVTAVHTADIKIPHKASTNSEVVAVINEQIPATLDIKSTKTWDSSLTSEKQSYQAGTGTSEAASELNFVYEVSAPTDTWLIGGKRKGHFRIPSSKDEIAAEKFRFPLILIPIKSGYLPYPHLEIKPTPTLKPTTMEARANSNGPIPGDDTASRADVITCETNYKNVGETIRVFSNARKITVSLDASGPQGGAWLLDTEKRMTEAGVFVL